MKQERRDAATAAVRKVLWEAWDPIGVNDSPGAVDEYDSYAPGVLARLRRGATDAEVAAHLARLERDAMGIGGSSPESHLAEVVRALRAAIAAA